MARPSLSEQFFKLAARITTSQYELATHGLDSSCKACEAMMQPPLTGTAYRPVATKILIVNEDRNHIACEAGCL